MRGTGGAAADSSLVGDADVDPAPVLDAHAARDEAIVLEPGNDACSSGGALLISSGAGAS